MANEFIIKNGYFAQGNSNITGSLSVSGGITGSLLGTASLASTASYALTASYVIGGSGAAFPYTGSAQITGSLGVTGSFAVIDTQGKLSIDANNRDLFDANASQSIAWASRRLVTADTSQSVNWSGRYLYDADNNLVLDWGQYEMQDATGVDSIRWNDRILYDVNASGSIAWASRRLVDENNNLSITWGTRELKKSDNTTTFDWENGSMTGSLSVSGSLITLTADNTQLIDPQTNTTLLQADVNGVMVYDTSGASSIDAQSRTLVDYLGNTTVVWGDAGDFYKLLYNNIDSVDWRARTLYDVDGSASIDYGNDSSGVGRSLIDAGGYTVLNWNTNAPEGAYFSGSLIGTASYAMGVLSASYALTASYIGTPLYTDNLITVGMPGSVVNYNSIKTAVDSIVDATQYNTYTVEVAPGVYIENTMTVPSWVAVRGDSSISTIVSASNPSSSVFVMSDQSMVIDMQIQGSTAPSASAIIYSSPTTPQTNAIAYVENVRFGTNYTNAKVIGTGSNGNCILQCSNVKYGGFTQENKTFDVGFHVTRTGSAGIGRMQLRNVTSTNGGITGSADQIFALSDAPNCAFIVNGCLLTRAVGAAAGTGFKVYNGGNLRLTGVNFQRWATGIWAPQTGSAPSIDAIALNFENCTIDALIEHTGSIGKIQGTDNFLKTQIALDAPLYEVGQDPRKITVGKKGADFTSISASVAYITDSDENNRYVIEVGPGQYTENTIDLTGKPYVSIVGSNIQTTQIFASSSTQHVVKMGINNEISFLSLANAGPGYAGIYVDDVGDFAQAHKVSIYNCDTGILVKANTTDTQFYGEYVDVNGSFSYGAYVSSSNGIGAFCNLENYYLFPSASATIGNYATGPSASLNLYTTLFAGDTTANSIAIKLEDGAQLEANGLDIQDWDFGYVVSNVGNPPLFRVVGSMIHDSVTYDFDIQKVGTIGRYQGVADHTKINNVSEEFYWNFLDDTDGENDITRKLSVTFADGTHTDATTLIFEGSPMGVMQGGTITISSSFTITTAAGYGYLHNMNSEVFQRIDWSDSNLTLSPNTNNYVFINETSTLTSSPTQPNSVHNIILGRVVTNSTGIELIDNSPYFAAHMSNALSKFNRNALGPVFADGCIVSENVTPFQLDINAGLYYFGENEYDPTGGTAITFTRYYQSGSGAFGWNLSASSVVPSDQYNSGSALVAMSSSYYTKHTLYTVGEGPDEEYFLVVGQNEYATLVEAENAGLPTPPTYFSDGVVSLAAIYVQSGSANITQIQDIRPIIGFRAAGVNASSIHGNLLGLDSDDHPQYFLADGTRPVNGNLIVTGSVAVTGSQVILTTDLFQVISPVTGDDLIYVDPFSGVTIKDDASNVGLDITSGLRKLYDLNGLDSVDFTNRQLIKSDGTTIAFDWENGSMTGSLNVTGSQVYLTTDDFQILDSINLSAYLSVDPANGVYLYDTVFISSLNSNLRTLFDSNEGNSIDWNNRQLIKSDGTTVTFDWENGALTSSLYGTASWAENVVSASYALTASYVIGGGGGGGSVDTGSLLTTASVSLNTITFTKGDGSTFPITVDTGSGGGGGGGTYNYGLTYAIANSQQLF